MPLANAKPSEAIINTMMPGVWATYKQSLKSSCVGYARAAFSFNGVTVEGTTRKTYGLVPVIIIELIVAVAALIKVAASVLLLPVITIMFIASPVINLVALPFYRRKSRKELEVYIDTQVDELARQREKVEAAMAAKSQ